MSTDPSSSTTAATDTTANSYETRSRTLRLCERAAGGEPGTVTATTSSSDSTAVNPGPPPAGGRIRPSAPPGFRPRHCAPRPSHPARSAPPRGPTDGWPRTPGSTRRSPARGCRRRARRIPNRRPAGCTAAASPRGSTGSGCAAGMLPPIVAIVRSWADAAASSASASTGYSRATTGCVLLPIDQQPDRRLTVESHVCCLAFAAWTVPQRGAGRRGSDFVVTEAATGSRTRTVRSGEGRMRSSAQSAVTSQRAGQDVSGSIRVCLKRNITRKLAERKPVSWSASSPGTRGPQEDT